MTTSNPTESPRIITTIDELRAEVKNARLAGKIIGLVPTMGALHQGHLSLVDASSQECDFNIVTIFVNPLQFAPHEDFEKYPRALLEDQQKLSTTKADIIFAPPKESVYAVGFCTKVAVSGLTQVLEGKARPTHFDGVTTIVLKLFNMVNADHAYFGQKDYQQAQIIRRMAEDLDVPTKIHVCPIVRDTDGIALSSRNQYLSVDERQQAIALSQSLKQVVRAFQQGETSASMLLEMMKETVSAVPQIEIDYLTLIHPETLLQVETVNASTVAIGAIRVGQTRLIDNARLSDEVTW